MSKSTRRALQFDCLEGKVLLSTGMADPAAAVYRQKTRRFVLNGAISGIPSGQAGPSGYVISSFPVSGHLASMGNVSGAFYLTRTFVGIGKMPNLSKASLVLASKKGSVAIGLSASGSHRYNFKVMSGTGNYTYASGSGNLVISASRNSLAFVIKMHSRHG